MDTHVWEALPQRKRKRHVNAAAATSAVADHDTITNNVNARSNLQRNNATLESLDGCAGEFYECKIQTVMDSDE